MAVDIALLLAALARKIFGQDEGFYNSRSGYISGSAELTLRRARSLVELTRTIDVYRSIDLDLVTASTRTICKSIMDMDIDIERGRRRHRNPEDWERNVRKKKRNSGEEYTSVHGRLVPAKNLDDDPECCQPRGNRRGPGHCRYREINDDERRALFETFWNLASYDLQNAHLFGLIERGHARHRRPPPDGGELTRSRSTGYRVV